MARPKDFDLAAELAKPSFTPGQRDLPALVEFVVAGADPTTTRASVALAKLGAAARDALAGRLVETKDEAARSRLVTVFGLLARAGDASARATLFAQLGDPTARVRRAAISALGKLPADDTIRVALVGRWDASDVTADERRVLAEALGKLGGDDAVARLRALDPRDDGELARRRDRALLMADREARRDADSVVVADAPPPSPVRVRLHCRAGLAPLLADELRALGHTPLAVGDAGVVVELAKPWSSLFAARLWTHAGVVLAMPRDEVRDKRGSTAKPKHRSGAGHRGARDTGDDDIAPDGLAEAITAALLADSTRALLRAWTRGPIRWRLGFAHGHRRAVVWRVARDVAAMAPELINDPTATTWDVFVDDGAHELELVPRKLADPRFAYRTAEVPAASHPTVAAALAWLAEPRASDRVWDPFCGSGLELVERARRGAVRSLLGTDLDDTALAAARANLAAAGVDAQLANADARTHAPGAVDLIITNPPLGSRHRGDAGALLAAALPNFARVLAAGGRLVWITPAPKKTTPVARAHGLVPGRQLAVDLGGVRGIVERWDKP